MNNLEAAQRLFQRRQFGIKPAVEDVTGALLGFDCYGRRDEAVRALQARLSEQWWRASGTMGHANVLAPYLLLVVPLFAA